MNSCSKYGSLLLPAVISVHLPPSSSQTSLQTASCYTTLPWRGVVLVVLFGVRPTGRGRGKVGIALRTEMGFVLFRAHDRDALARGSNSCRDLLMGDLPRHYGYYPIVRFHDIPEVSVRGVVDHTVTEAIRSSRNMSFHFHPEKAFVRWRVRKP